MSEQKAPTQLKEGLYWVGDSRIPERLNCNPYLLFDGDSVLLFDPGSVLDAQIVIEKVSRLVPIERIDAIVLSHQDPDLCSAIPEFERQGFQGLLCAHERAATIITYYGVKSQFYYVNQQKFRYRLKDGTYIKFLPAPYLHFPGAIMTYLPRQKTLISGDLFGAFALNWQLFAGDDYMEAMKTYHESYMPSKAILSSVMSNIEPYDINMICPQHGSVINHDISMYIDTLKNLECGMFMQPVFQDLIQHGGYISLCSDVLARYISIYGTRAVRKIFTSSGFVVDYGKKRIVSAPSEGEKLWNDFFDLVVLKQGLGWLTIVSALVEQISLSFNVPLPHVFESIVYDAHKQQEGFDAERKQLFEEKKRLQFHLQSAQEHLMHCPVTGLYNRQFFDEFLLEEFESHLDKPKMFAVLLLSLDNLAQINLNFSSDEGNAAMRNLAYLLSGELSGTRQVFRLEGGTFAIYLTNIGKDAAVLKANRIKNEVADSKMFITEVTISIGLVHIDDIRTENIEQAAELREEVLKTARFRLKSAQKFGGNAIVHQSSSQNSLNAMISILLVDAPGLQRELITTRLEHRNYRVITADDGAAALKTALSEHPDIIIAEHMLRKKSAFTLRRGLRDSSGFRNTPFILLTHYKDESTVSQAFNLGISHVLSRPVMLTELLGIVEQLGDSLHREE